MNVKLLRKVKRHILAEPKRFDMYAPARGSTAAPCGTVGCIAGWAAILSGAIEPPKGSQDRGWVGIRAIARRVLKLKGRQSWRLFHTSNWPEQFLYGTTRKRDAQVAAARIEHFIKTKGRE